MRSKTATKHKGDDMSKFLKFIVNLFLTLAIIVTAGIIIPPLLGVNTTIVDTAAMDTNLPLGSVTYSRDKAVMDLLAGDEILKESGSATYAYIVQEGDATTGEFTVVSATEPNASPEVVILRNSVSEVVLTVPYIGFVVVAMQSLEGRIIIALVILFIIILFILSELWKKRDDDEDEEDDDAEGIPGNVQAASAEKTGDAGKSASGTGVRAGYSENVTDNRGYGTVSQDTGSIAAAMIGLEAIEEKKNAAINTRPDEASSLDTEVEPSLEMPAGNVSGGDSRVISVEERTEIAPQAMEADEATADRSDMSASLENSETSEVTGDTKVFPGNFASQINNMTAKTETAAGNDIVTDRSTEDAVAAPKISEKDISPRKEDVFEEALIAETEKAAASWNDTSAQPGPGQEPKPLWSWTDEPFENELDGDSWNSYTSRGAAGGANEYPERFAPVERMTRQEIIDQARTGGNEPKIQRDEVTGIDIIDYSDLL